MQQRSFPEEKSSLSSVSPAQVQWWFIFVAKKLLIELIYHPAQFSSHIMVSVQAE